MAAELQKDLLPYIYCIGFEGMLSASLLAVFCAR